MSTPNEPRSDVDEIVDHLVNCSDAQAAIVVDGSADELVESLASAGWGRIDRVEYIAGKRIRYMTIPSRDNTKNQREPQVYERAICIWCKQALHRFSSDGVWLASQIAGFGDNPECTSRPNPDDGPMLGHEPSAPPARNPRWQDIEDQEKQEGKDGENDG